MRWKSCVHRAFSQESIGERIVKIGPYLPKLLSNIKWLTFLRHSVFINVVHYHLVKVVHLDTQFTKACHKTKKPTGKIVLLASSFCHFCFPVLESISFKIAVILGKTRWSRLLRVAFDCQAHWRPSSQHRFVLHKQLQCVRQVGHNICRVNRKHDVRTWQKPWIPTKKPRDTATDITVNRNNKTAAFSWKL